VKEISVKQLAELAREVESTDPIDWGELNISEQHAYEMIASQILEQFYEADDDIEDQLLIMLSVVVKLTVENFVLNLKIQSGRR
jgi:hypothetical protein